MFQDISNKQYHSTPAISASWLKMMNKSAAHVWYHFINPQRPQSTPTAAMLLGSLTHTLVLEPEKLAIEYVVVPEGIDRRSKDGKAFFAEIEAAGKTPIKQADFDQCAAMAESLRSNAMFRVIRACRHENERTYQWDDPVTGLACKMRPDTLVHACEAFPRGALTDVKTTADSSPAGFGRQFFALGYHIQAAHNAIGYMHAFGMGEPEFWLGDDEQLHTNMPEFVFECVEKEAPYITQCYRVPADVMQYGVETVARLMDEAAACFEHDTWPGYTQESMPDLLVPGWIRREMEDSGDISIEFVGVPENE